MSTRHSGQIQPQLDLEEHDGVNNAKRVSFATDSSVKITDGTDTATVASALDSRNGLDIQHSSVASKNIVDFHSNVGGVGAGGQLIFSPGGTRSTYYDLDGYEGFYISFTDNSPGASGGTLYMRWSRDGVNTAYNDINDGTGLTNYDGGLVPNELTIARFIPRKTRYVNFVYVQGSSAQGTTYPQLCELNITLFPTFFTNAVQILNSVIGVQGNNADVASAAGSGLVIAGVDSPSSPTAITPLVVDSTGNAAVKGTATNFTGAPIITTQKLSATGTESSVTAGTTSGTLVASSTSRLRVLAYNNGTYEVYYRLSSSACTTASGGYTGIIWPGTTEPIGLDVPYSGAVTCITPAGTGNSTISLTVI